MKIISFVDKEGSAIHRLAMMTAKRCRHHQILVVPFHPKRPSIDEIRTASQGIEWADLIDFQYWKSAAAIVSMFPKALDKPNVLTHHNEHNINGDWEWKKYNWGAHVCKNGWQKKELEAQGIKPKLIRHAVEFNNFDYVSELTDQKIVGYVGQIKKNKGVRELKQACDELGYRLLVVGGVSEAGYWEELPKDNLMIATGVPDAADKAQEMSIGDYFKTMRVYCANSDDGTESGTMPILEAMVSGIPVVTRKIGLVRDCGEHGKNMFIREGAYTDIEDLKRSLKMVMENQDVADEIRENAWRTVRQYHPDIQAREYDLLWRKLVHGDETPVSVIMPTYQRPDTLYTNLQALSNQTYRNFEVVICDDGSEDQEANQKVVEMAITNYGLTVRYVNTNKQDEYGLAAARNMGIIEATGEILVFCDDRLQMHERAIEGFVKKLKSYNHKKVWVWGSKGSFKSFVENFSASWRRSVIDGGMFCERIDEYGGMTQEVSHRFAAQKFIFEWCPEALAEPIIGTHSKSKNRESIIRQKIKLYKMGYQ